jgi:hypothetical protein
LTIARLSGAIRPYPGSATVPSDDDKPKGVTAAIVSAPVVAEAYRDLVKPSAIELSKDLLAATKVVRVLLLPLHGIAWGYDKISAWLEPALAERLVDVPPDQIQTPPPYIAGQVLMQLPFCAEQEQLRELYANLLASAMQKGRASQAHPAFVQVIQQLTPDEALLLKAIGSYEKPAFWFLNETYPTDYPRERDAAEGIAKQFESFCESAGVVHMNQREAYLDNLIRLRLLTDHHWSEGAYEPEGHNERGDWGPSVRNTAGRLLELSAFGDAFIAMCLPRDSSPH